MGNCEHCHFPHHSLEDGYEGHAGQMKLGVVIVAAGRGLRAGGEVPKQWRDVAGIPIAERTLRAMHSHPAVSEIVMVLHPDDTDLSIWSRDLVSSHVTGGETRSASVKAGLGALSEKTTHVLIHDVARPLVTSKVIDGVIEALNLHDAAAPALAVTDALWRGENGSVSATVDRSNLFRAQTPQGFELKKIRAAHDGAEAEAADDVEVARAAGLRVVITEGDPDNIKITHPQDFERAEKILRARQVSHMDIRVGNGFDVHRFGPGEKVILCGIDIPHSRGLQGHSDADVALHTVTDAIYGALAEGDIGRHFPPSDPQWKDAASDIFLAHAVKLAADKGFRISNVDCTLICELPKIGPHAAKMQSNLARILETDASRVSIKATTSEKLGFTGREEGIACMATVTLVSK